MESDYQEPQTIDTRVVMGQEALLKTTETQKARPPDKPSGQAIPLPAIPSLSDPQTQAKESGYKVNNEERQVQTISKQQEQQKEPVQPPNILSLPLNKPLCPSSTGPITTDENVKDNQEEVQTRSQDEVPCLSFSETACPVALSFSEPAYAVDPLRVGVPASLDPDLYYTAPSTPIKMASCSSHLKHHSYPGSPACPLSPSSPSDSEDLCSPLTSPSGSYITAEGGSWTSSYTSSTSPSTSPNLLLTEEAQEAPACFVGSLSEIGDEVGEEKGRTGPEREEERVRDFCSYRPQDCVLNSQVGVTGTVILEEDEAVKEEEIKVSRESCRPRWVTEDTSLLRSSSSRSSDSQEDGGESESSLCPLEDASEGKVEYPRSMQTGLKLQLEACMSGDNYGQMEDHSELRSTAMTPDIEDLTMASSSVSPDSPVIPLDDFCPGAFGRLFPSSFMLSHAACADDIPEEERMIPASLISFPLHTSLIFKADSMEITLFPTEEENEIEEVNDINEGEDVNAYAAGEEEADVEDDDDDEENYDYDDDDPEGDDVDENNEDNDSNDHNEVGEEAKVEVKVVEEEEEEQDEDEDEEECDSKAVEDPTDEDSSASFLHSLSETSINEGLDESFCFQDDTDDSLDSASYNGEEDESLYSTERHAQSLEPTPVDALDQTEIQPESQHASTTDTGQTEHLHTPQSRDKLDLSESACLFESTAAHPTDSNIDPIIVDEPEPPESQFADPEPESTDEIGHTKSLQLQVSSDKGPVDHQKVSHDEEAVSHQPESSSDLDEGGTGSEAMDISDSFASLEQLKHSPHVNPLTTPESAPEFPISSPSPLVTQEINRLVLAEELAEGRTHLSDLELKHANDYSEEETTPERTGDDKEEEPTEEPERDSFKLLLKPRHYQAESQRTVGATRLALSKSFSIKPDHPGETKIMCGSSLHRESDTELDRKNGNASADSSSTENRYTDSGPLLNLASATNDLNKGVPLLSCPKDPGSNPSNIPFSAFPEIISEVADNLALTPEHGPGDSAQENLRENTLSTDEGVLGAVGSPHSPLAISPKRENSETDTSRETDSGAGAWCDDRVGLGFGLGLGSGIWGARESLSLSLGKKYEFESESLLMCDTEGQSTQMVVVPNSNDVCKDYDNVLGSVLDEEDNNSLSGRRADQELLGEISSESNLACWKSIEEISEAGGGEFGSSRFPEDDVSNLNPGNNGDNADTQIQDGWGNSDNNNDSAFDSLEVAMCGNLNALSEEVRPQSVSVSARESVSNIPLEEMPPQAPETTPDEDRQPTDGDVIQTSDTAQPPSSKEGICSTHMDRAVTKPHLSSPNKTKSRCPTDPGCQIIPSESNTALSWLHGSFGPFTPKCKSNESRPSKACQDEVKTTGPQSDLNVVPSQTEGQRKDETSAATNRVLNEPKSKDAFRGQQYVACNSGEDDDEEKEAEPRKGNEGKGKKDQKESKTSPAQNGPEHFMCHSPKGELCTDKPITGKKGRRGKQNKQRASQTGSQADSSSESFDDPKKPLLSSAEDEKSKETVENSSTNPGQSGSFASSVSDCQQRPPGTDKAESGSQLPGDNNHSPDAALPCRGYCTSNTHAADNLNVVAALNRELHQKHEVLDNRTLSDSQGGPAVDINDNNIDTTHSPSSRDTISYPLTPLSSSASPVPSSPTLPASAEPEDDLPTPVQESQPLLPVEQPPLSKCHTTPTLCSTCTTTQVLNSQFVPNNNNNSNNLQEVTVVLSTPTTSATRVSSPSLSTALPLTLSQPTQESPLPESGTPDPASVLRCISHPESQSFSRSQPKLNVESHKPTKQGHAWSTQGICRG